MAKNYFFWGCYKGQDTDPTWKTLYEHFEKLAKEDELVEFDCSERKPTKERKND